MTRVSNPNYSNGTGTKENIRAIEQDIERHQKNLNELYIKFDVIGRTNWQTFLSAVGVFTILLGALWGLAVLPINADVKRIELGLQQIQGMAGARGITLAENNVKIGHLDDKFSMLRTRVQRVADEHVSSKEFAAALSATIAARVELQREVSTLTKKIDDVFPPQKTLEDLTRRLAELERTRILVAPVPVRP